MVKAIVAAIGGHGVDIQAVTGARATNDHRVALMQTDPHIAVHRGLGAVDEGIEGLFEGTEPKTLVDQVGPGHLHLALITLNIRSQGEALQVLMGTNQ